MDNRSQDEPTQPVSDNDTVRDVGIVDDPRDSSPGNLIHANASERDGPAATEAIRRQIDIYESLPRASDQAVGAATETEDCHFCSERFGQINDAGEQEVGLTVHCCQKMVGLRCLYKIMDGDRDKRCPFCRDPLILPPGTPRLQPSSPASTLTPSEAERIMALNNPLSDEQLLATGVPAVTSSSDLFSDVWGRSLLPADRAGMDSATHDPELNAGDNNTTARRHRDELEETGDHEHQGGHAQYTRADQRALYAQVRAFAILNIPRHRALVGEAAARLQSADTEDSRALLAARKVLLRWNIQHRDTLDRLIWNLDHSPEPSQHEISQATISPREQIMGSLNGAVESSPPPNDGAMLVRPLPHSLRDSILGGTIDPHTAPAPPPSNTADIAPQDSSSLQVTESSTDLPLRSFVGGSIQRTVIPSSSVPAMGSTLNGGTTVDLAHLANLTPTALGGRLRTRLVWLGDARALNPGDIVEAELQMVDLTDGAQHMRAAHNGTAEDTLEDGEIPGPSSGV